MQCKSKHSERQRRQAGQDKAAHAVGAISRHIWCALLIHGTEEVVVALSCFCSEMKGGRKGAQGKQATNQPGVWLLASLIPRHRLLVPPLNSVEKAPSVHFVPPPRCRHECAVVVGPSAWAALPVALVLPASRLPSSGQRGRGEDRGGLTAPARWLETGKGPWLAARFAASAWLLVLHPWVRTPVPGAGGICFWAVGLVGATTAGQQQPRNVPCHAMPCQS